MLTTRLKNQRNRFVADPDILVAVDPGVGGGWCVMKLMDASGPIDCGVMPTFPSGKGSAREYDVPAIARILRKHRPIAVNIEEVRFYPVGYQMVRNERTRVLERRPRWPAPSSIRKLSQGADLWQGAAAALEIGVTMVPPKDWQAVMLRGQPAGKTGPRAIAVATSLFPATNFVPPRCRLPHDGIAVAVLLCEFGRRQLCGLKMDCGH
jgi:hypothetical protein